MARCDLDALIKHGLLALREACAKDGELTAENCAISVVRPNPVSPTHQKHTHTDLRQYSAPPASAGASRWACVCTTPCGASHSSLSRSSELPDWHPHMIATAFDQPVADWLRGTSGLRGEQL